MEYLEKIHIKHENWFKDPNPKKVLILDTTEDFKNDEKKIQDMIYKLREFINGEWLKIFYFHILNFWGKNKKDVITKKKICLMRWNFC